MDSPTAPTAKVEFLRRAEETPYARRAADLRDLQEALEWCDLNSSDPQAEPNAIPIGHGGDHLTRCGGQGTPDVAQLCAAEYAIARQAGERATWNLMSDALDLRHRFPLVWVKGQELVSELWVLRRIVVMARRLTKEQAARVDRAMVEVLGQSPGRILQIAEARIIEADVRGHADRIREDNSRRGVWFPKPSPGEQLEVDGISGSRRVAARLKPGQSGELDHTIDVIADHLADEYAADPDAEMPSRDQLRAEALAYLADPHAAAAIIDAAQADPEAAIVEQRPERKQKTSRRAKVFIHIDADVLADGADGVARVEDWGPVLLSQLAELLGRADITLTPVVDLRTFTSVNAYEHPATMKLRTELRTVGDVFPHSAHHPGRGAVDHDHAVAWESDGPPGQTNDLNDAPLSRRHHRAKTHHAYLLRQTGPGRYEWTTPHGLRRIVDRAGTHIPAP
ncbi:MAG: hypothetical protein NTX33_07960 [Propionibacteriales bacterium]|nr:hypothetical protein [Propionibacteriales bacterium]